MQNHLQPHKKISRARWQFLLLAAFAPLHALFAQVSVSGPTCVATGTSYTYTISGSWNNTTYMQWTVSGGVITGTSNTVVSGTPMPQIHVTFSSSTGGVYLYTTTIGSSTVNVSAAPSLAPGTLSSGGSQGINYNTLPASIISAASTGGSCSPSYSYQWQQSTDAVNYTAVSGATALTLSFSSALTQTTYYRLFITETSSGSTGYSSTATVIVYPQLTAGSISPSSISANYNTSPGQLTGTAATGGNGSYAYAWQSSPDNSTWSAISGATAQNYTPGNLTATTYYRRSVTSNGVGPLYTVSSAVTVYPLLVSGTASPSSAAINYNTAPGTFTSTAATGGNGTYAYQWQSSPNNSTWSNVSGATGLAYTPPALTATTYYHLVSTSNSLPVTGNLVTATVYPQVTTVISPASASINYSTSPGQLTNTLGGGNGSYTYQWQSSPNGTTWTAISGATSQNYTPGNLTATTYYNVIATSNGVAVTSNTGTITVYPLLNPGSISPASESINWGTSPGLLTGTAPTGGNGSYTYLWYSSPDNSTWTGIGSTNVQSYTPGMITANTYYLRQVISNGVILNTNSAAITVYPQLNPGSISPGSESINWGTSPGLLTGTLPTGGNGTYTYLWYSSPNNSTWTAIGSTNTQNYTPGTITANTYYLRQVISNGVILNTNSAAITVYPQLNPGSISPASESINWGTSPGLLTGTAPTGGNGSYTYLWYSSPDNSTWTGIGSTNTQNYTPGTITATTYYLRQVVSNGVILNSNTATVTVYPLLNPGSISPGSESINWGTSPGLLTGTLPTGGNGTYTYLWYSSPNNSTWTAIGSTNTQNYTPGTITATTYYLRQVVSNGVILNSNTATVTVYPQLQPGSISPSVISVGYGAGSNVLTPTNPTGGNGTYAYQWQSAPDGSTWATITGATTQNYTVPTLSASGYYRQAVTSNGVTVYTNSAQVQLPLYGGIISSSVATVSSGGSATLTSVQGAANGTCGGSYTYQWQSSFDEINWSNNGGTSITGITATTYYRRNVVCGTATTYSNTIRIKVTSTATGLIAPNGVTAPMSGTQTAVAMPGTYNTLNPANLNYIRTRDFTEPGIADTTTAAAATGVYNVHQVTQYLDGIGRPMETVAMKATPLQHDLISTDFYDPFGREIQKYLPYSDTGTNGGFRTNAPTQQPAFYNTLLNNTDAYYYQNSILETSPMNRVLKTTDPGNSWTGSNRGIGGLMRVNNWFDSVQIWNITYGAADMPTSGGLYLPGTLTVTETNDENDNKTIEYKDLVGHVVLKKSQQADAQGVGHTGWLCTYYVYDDLGHLRYVMPPKAVQYLQQNNWVLTATIGYQLCYRYVYDQRGRPIAKQIPGTGETDMVYDEKDRLVMSQDSAQRLGIKWLVMVYDSLSRPVKTVYWSNSSTAAYHQGLASVALTYPALSGSYTVETESFYDNYTWLSRSDINLSGHAYSTKFNNGTDLPVIQTNPYALTPTGASMQTRGLATGSRAAIIDPTGQTSGYMYAISWFDDHNRMVQAQASNISTGWDTVTNKYDFGGKVLATCQAHGYVTTKGPVKWNMVVTAMNYDHAGRLLSANKYLNGATTPETLAVNTYDELGRLKTKQLGNKPVETLTYGYTVKGWLKGINSSYATTAGSLTNWFGEDISYDYGFNQNQYNGNIAGVIWKTQGDDSAKAYGYNYDNINRLLKGDFTQQMGAGYAKGNQLDFNVDSLTYDANGNILLMQQKGCVINSSTVVDHLVYTYMQTGGWSNQLYTVADNSGNTAPLGDFKDSTNTGADYTYDGNGRLLTDNNKHISRISYNYLNLPQSVYVSGRGYVYYVYDAAGNKLRKIVIDSAAAGGAHDTATTYTGPFVYQNDTLQYIGHEEGRIRYSLKDSSYKFDYYIRDHLGDIRMTLTEETEVDAYQATMENKNAAVENALFDSVASTQFAVPTGFEPTTGADTSNHYVSRLNASINQRVGPTLLLRVMAGDTLTASSYAWYSGAVQAPTNDPSLLNSLGTLLAGNVLGLPNSKYIFAEQGALTTAVGPGLTSFLSAKDTAYTTSAPKAFLNWALLDDRFNYVSGGVTQVPVITGSMSKQVLTANLPSVIPKNGYLYIYVSNESPQDVYFDNVTVQHHRGPLLEEEHYYPFGLTMAGISSQAAGKMENLHKFNKSSELQHKEFSDGSGLELYATNFRSLDPQIGRWWQVDPKPNMGESPYASMKNNPIAFNDPLGDTTWVYNQNGVSCGVVNDKLKNQVDYIHTDNDPSKPFDASKLSAKDAKALGKAFRNAAIAFIGSKTASDMRSIVNGSIAKKIELGFVGVVGADKEIRLKALPADASNTLNKVDLTGQIDKQYSSSQQNSDVFLAGHTHVVFAVGGYTSGDGSDMANQRGEGDPTIPNDYGPNIDRAGQKGAAPALIITKWGFTAYGTGPTPEYGKPNPNNNETTYKTVE